MVSPGTTCFGAHRINTTDSMLPSVPLMASTAALPLNIFGLTDRRQMRKSNMDQFAGADLRRVLHVQCSSIPHPDSLVAETLGQLMVVADGMGGHRGDDVASTMAVVGIENLLLDTINWLCQPHGEGVLRELNQALRPTDRWVGQVAGRRPGRGDVTGLRRHRRPVRQRPEQRSSAPAPLPRSRPR